MNLSSLVHAGRYQLDYQHNQNSTQSDQAMATSLFTEPYHVQRQHQHQDQDHHHHQHHHHQNSRYTYINAPRPPPSPPVEDTSKFSLPSISSLLGFADASSPPEQAQQQVQAAKSDSASEWGYQPYGTSQALSSRTALPPTPPMRFNSAPDSRQTSPPAFSNSGYSVASAPSYYFAPNAPTAVSAMNDMEPQIQRQQVPAAVEKRVSTPAQTMSYGLPAYNHSKYGMSPPQSTESECPSPIQQASLSAQAQISGLRYQRPLPQQFPPPMMPVATPLAPSSSANPWQHHHYISPSSVVSFPQSQDRYICQTCNKAFSRPSSLRIHSHSHTGEKPFKCPHPRCGKAFSVRSNMKRHERGCRSFNESSMS